MAGRVVGLSLLLVLMASAICGQSNDRPNFSGTWERSVKNIFLPKKQGIKYKSFLRIVIEHVDPVFSVTTYQRVESFNKAGEKLGSTRKMLTKTMHYTDERGESNVSSSKAVHISKTRWDEAEILVKATVEELDNWKYEYRYRLSKDGKKVTMSYLGDSLVPNRTFGSGYIYFKPTSVVNVFLKVS